MKLDNLQVESLVNILLVRTAYPEEQYRLISENNFINYGEIWQDKDGDWHYAPLGVRKHNADSLKDAITGLLDHYGKKACF